MKMTKTIKGMLIPMNISDIDTDMIIPAQYLTSTSQDGFGQYAFSRFKINPDFVLNQAKYKNAPILLTGANFGCGSSREHAVWAIQELGIKAIIAPSFADIFANNAKKNGLLLIALDKNTIEEITNKALINDLVADIDIDKQTVDIDGHIHRFTLDLFFKHCLINGLDELDYLMANIKEIKQFKQQQINQTLFINN